MSPPLFIVRPVNWLATRDKLAAVRRAVFVIEQNVPEELEWDQDDERAYHVLATAAEDGAPIGTGRLKLDCHIGRMAVVQQWRRRGVGSAILRTLVELAAKEGCAMVRLHAQTHAMSFYEVHGFTAYGPQFDEAGIAHRKMELSLVRRSQEQ
jgi:predicted GNAT family N-acyltransferase